MQNRDIKTLGYVLKRTNYGEFDRILNIITPNGKISAIAKGVRKEKSKLAGGVEMFTLVNFNIHLGRGEFGTVTGVKMIKYYGEIIKDLAKMELAGMILKVISKVSESSDNPEYFKITDQCLRAIDAGERLDVVEAWFLVNLGRSTGEEINLYYDVEGSKLLAENKYSWDSIEKAFIIDANGTYGADEIKLLRLMASSDLSIVGRVKANGETIDLVLQLARGMI